MGEANFRSPTLPKSLNQFGWRFKYITTFAQGVDVQNLMEIDSAVMSLRMREKSVFLRIFTLRHAMLARVLAVVVVSLYVCLSVCYTPVLYQNG